MMRAFLPLIPEDSESPESSPKGTDQPPVQREEEETPGTSSQGKSVNKQPKAVESGFEDLFKSEDIAKRIEDEITALNKKEDAIRESYGEQGRRRTRDEERMFILQLLTIERERAELFRRAYESEAIFRIEAEERVERYKSFMREAGIIHPRGQEENQQAEEEFQREQEEARQEEERRSQEERRRIQEEIQREELKQEEVRKKRAELEEL